MILWTGYTRICHANPAQLCAYEVNNLHVCFITFQKLNLGMSCLQDSIYIYTKHEYNNCDNKFVISEALYIIFILKKTVHPNHTTVNKEIPSPLPSTSHIAPGSPRQ